MSDTRTHARSLESGPFFSYQLFFPYHQGCFFVLVLFNAAPSFVALLRFHDIHFLSILFLFKQTCSFHYIVFFHVVCLFEKAFPLQTTTHLRQCSLFEAHPLFKTPLDISFFSITCLVLIKLFLFRFNEPIVPTASTVPFVVAVPLCGCHAQVTDFRILVWT